MTDTIKVFGVHTPERQRLESAAMLINSNFDYYHASAKVEDAWFDFEGGVRWTTLTVGGVPVSPQQQIELTTGTFREFAAVVSVVVNAYRDRIQALTSVRYGLQEEA